MSSQVHDVSLNASAVLLTVDASNDPDYIARQPSCSDPPLEKRKGKGFSRDHYDPSSIVGDCMEQILLGIFSISLASAFIKLYTTFSDSTCLCFMYIPCLLLYFTTL